MASLASRLVTLNDEWHQAGKTCRGHHFKLSANLEAMVRIVTIVIGLLILSQPSSRANLGTIRESSVEAKHEVGLVSFEGGLLDVTFG
ncbi:hypothetical protein [Nocardia brasiliensis]|uniref:hypothetical protein n=1 Tax=Nocardia brasiliensis TaxID=37326 RepID=UPI0024554512|nr:hypothetical protein [Nocardia brasiliensis]